MQKKYGNPISLEFLTDMWRYLATRKKWWLLPMVVVLFVVGLLLVVAGTTSVAPFIYTLF